MSKRCVSGSENAESRDDGAWRKAVRTLSPCSRRRPLLLTQTYWEVSVRGSMVSPVAVPSTLVR